MYHILLFSFIIHMKSNFMVCIQLRACHNHDQLSHRHTVTVTVTVMDNLLRHKKALFGSLVIVTVTVYPFSLKSTRLPSFIKSSLPLSDSLAHEKK